MLLFKHYCRFFIAKKSGYTVKIYNFGSYVKKQPVNFI